MSDDKLGDPMLPVIEGVWQAAIQWTAAGQTAKNVLYFHAEAGGTGEGLAGALSSEAIANMFHTMSDDAVADHVVITALDGVSGPVPYTLTDWVGTESAEFVPAASCCLTLYTGAGGRSNRGRIYLPFLSESVQNDGHFIGDAATVVEPAWNAWASAMGDAGWTPVVASLILFHTDHGVETDPSVPHATPVVFIKHQQILATQRRRQSRLRIT
jgi:hypothetical protein